MDEVDLILHPLRSELNFPIGDKLDLDFNPLRFIFIVKKRIRQFNSFSFFRWRLPFHIFDAIFYAETEKLYGDLRDSETSLQILNQFKKVVDEGFACKSLQKNPHIVLLDLDFYRLKMRPILTDWVILWLNYHHFSGLNQSQVRFCRFTAPNFRKFTSFTDKRLSLRKSGKRARIGRKNSFKGVFKAYKDVKFE